MSTAYLVQGLLFGDEGKGTTVDALVRKTGADLVVRFNGGPQTAHHVVLPDGRSHCFSQFGSGTLAGARTHLSRFMLVEPMALQREAQSLKNNFDVEPYELLRADPRCVVVTPYHVALNQLKELCRGDERHGSCGRGIGETRFDQLNGLALTLDDLLGHHSVAKLHDIRERVRRDATFLVVNRDDPHVVKAVAQLLVEPWRVERDLRVAAKHILLNTLWETTGDVVFEGSQGVLLDETHGFAPHVTWTNCMFENAYTVLQEAGWKDDVVKIGVVRAYATRHGAGPFPTENTVFTEVLREPHNPTGAWTGAFRCGGFDSQLVRKSLEIVGGVDWLSVTCLDRLQELKDESTKRFVTFLLRDTDPIQCLTEIIQDTRTPVGLASYGPTYEDKRWPLNDMLRRMSMESITTS
jgi:adenylosuccinate synthase